MAPRPLLVAITGPPGSGKTALAQRLTEEGALALPRLSRDLLKAGLVWTEEAETEAVRLRAFDLFFDTAENWLRANVSLIADQTFRRVPSEERFSRLLDVADAVAIECQTSREVAHRRFKERERANGNIPADRLAEILRRMEDGTYQWDTFRLSGLGVPELCVDTTEGYAPGLEAIIEFCRSRGVKPQAAL
ncbi:MAG: AAA family ATPase [Dehalococcoidia bacterium]|nr:AAA family ATPase [Dehalococcoidia bacterium]